MAQEHQPKILEKFNNQSTKHENPKKIPQILIMALKFIASIQDNLQNKSKGYTNMKEVQQTHEINNLP